MTQHRHNFTAPAHSAEGQLCWQCGADAWHVDTTLPFCRDHDQATLAATREDKRDGVVMSAAAGDLLAEFWPEPWRPFLHWHGADGFGDDLGAVRELVDAGLAVVDPQTAEGTPTIRLTDAGRKARAEIAAKR